MQREMEDVGTGALVTPADAKASLSLGMGYATPALAAPGATLLSGYYSRGKLVTTAQSLVGFLSPDQLSYDNHLFFEGLHPLSSDATTVLSLSREICFRIAVYCGSLSRGFYCPSY